MYLSTRVQGTPVLVEMTFQAASAGCTIVTKARAPVASQIAHNILAALLSAPQ
jgi:hypothetical protein